MVGLGAVLGLAAVLGLGAVLGLAAVLGLGADPGLAAVVQLSTGRERSCCGGSGCYLKKSESRGPKAHGFSLFSSSHEQRAVLLMGRPSFYSIVTQQGRLFDKPVIPFVPYFNSAVPTDTNNVQRVTQKCRKHAPEQFRAKYGSRPIEL